jgi:hypothetical protein
VEKHDDYLEMRLKSCGFYGACYEHLAGIPDRLKIVPFPNSVTVRRSQPSLTKNAQLNSKATVTPWKEVV